ncbi:MAG: hypothetical protein ACN6RF_04985 [Stenotrophomonas sp.]
MVALHGIRPARCQRATPWHLTRAQIHDDLEQIHDDLEQIRRLRNRIAHHEPIFARALADDFAAILRVIGRRCGRTAEWMSDHESVTQLLVDRPT